MTRAELIAELERLAHVFEGHPVHVDMSETLREAVYHIDMLTVGYHLAIKPSPRSNGQPRHAPDDT